MVMFQSITKLKDLKGIRAKIELILSSDLKTPIGKAGKAVFGIRGFLVISQMKSWGEDEDPDRQ